MSLLVFYSLRPINVPHGRVAQRASRLLLPRPHHNTTTTTMPRQQHQLDASKERQINLAVKALKQDLKLSQQHAAAIYKVPQSTLSVQRARQLLRVNYMPVLTYLTGEPPTFTKTTLQHYPSTNALLNTPVRRVKRTLDKPCSRSS